MNVDPADLYEGRERFERATAEFRTVEVTDPASPAFDEAFGAMWAYFGPKNEIERRPVLERWLHDPLVGGTLEVRYHLLAWRDRRTDALAGVRDLFVGVDRARRMSVTLLSHSFVLPEYRRSGVATLIRTAPATVARRTVAEAGMGEVPVLLGAEMEPVVPADPASVVRLLSYGRSGYGAIPPDVLPYCQPDFRDLAALGVEALPIPMPCVVRWVGHEDEHRIPTALAASLVETFAALHLRACEPGHVEALAAADLAALERYGRPDIDLVVLPTTPAEIERLAPLLRSRALLRYPERYRVAMPDPDADLAALHAAGRALEAR